MTIKVMKQALEMIRSQDMQHWGYQHDDVTITALRQAIEQAERSTTCSACERYFSKYSCGKNYIGECDCPKCQGYCKCDLSQTYEQAQPVAKDIAAAVLDHCYGSGAVTDDMIERAAQVVAAKIYTAPPQRQPLTNQQIEVIGRPCEKFTKDGSEWFDRLSFARAIERAHGIGEG